MLTLPLFSILDFATIFYFWAAKLRKIKSRTKEFILFYAEIE